MSDPPEIVWQPKDIVVLVPVLASSLAISWEVGRFWPTGGFWFFSLSEHFLAAMLALPVAMAVTFLFAVFLPLIEPLSRRLSAKSSKIFLAACFLSIIIGEAALVAFLAYRSETFGGVVALSAAMLLFVANTFWFKRRILGPVGLLAIFGMSILMSLFTSADLSLESLKKADQNYDISMITTKSGTISAYLIMAGERGVLLYNPATKRISFNRSDEIQSIEWNIMPAIQGFAVSPSAAP